MRLDELSDGVLSHILKNFLPDTPLEVEFIYDNHSRCVIWHTGLPEMMDRESLANGNGRYVVGFYGGLRDLFRNRSQFVLAKGVTSDNYLG